MNVLIVCSGNFPDFSFEENQAFIYDQVNKVQEVSGISFFTFFIKGKGVKGYLSNLKRIKKKIRQEKIDLIHAHGGHIGSLSALQSIVPVVVTFHGSDINYKKNRFFSAFASLLSKHSIYVSQKLIEKAFIKGVYSIIPCGVDFGTFLPLRKGQTSLGEFILFSSHFSNSVKNFPLLKTATKNLSEEIREIKDKSRIEVNLLLNNAKILVMTSFSEGSPQIIKEAMACNIPIVSTDVGDVKEVIGATEGCYICSYDPKDVAKKIKLALAFGKRTNGREKIKHLDNKVIAERIMNVYKSVLKN
jgi:teichuronic acid biosynthesis glycosyltransferase TuaC